MQIRNVHMMQMSHAGVQMQSLSMMVPVHIFKPWCKCLLVGMSWRKCFDANTIYSKIPFVFKIKASSAPETKIFSNLDLLFLKSHLFFLTKGSQKKLVNTARNLWIGHWLEIWWSGSKVLFSPIWLSKEVARFQGIFLEKRIF